MRSAVYYPRTQVQSRPLMQSSLLLWDQLHTIVPQSSYSPSYGDRRDMAEAWELIGRTIVPNDNQQHRAHEAISVTLQSGLPANLYNVGQVDQPDDYYEVWPQKFSTQTFHMLREHGLTDFPLPNGDYPFTQEGGLLVMAKLADACAGTQFARVTDRLMAYGMIGSGDQRSGIPSDVVPITLDLIDASGVPLENLIALRRREQSERRGSDYTRLRHAYADAVQQQISALGAALDQFERDELTRQFRDKMEIDLKDLRRELRGNLTDVMLKPVVIATVATSGALLSGLAHGAEAALAYGLAAAFGSEVKDVAKTIAGFASDRMSFSKKQREVMLKHPMAYMYALSEVR